MAVNNSSNPSDTSTKVAHLIDQAKTAMAKKDTATATAELAEVKDVLTTSAGDLDKDTIDKVKTQVTLLNADLTQGLSLDGNTQDAHMQKFVAQVQALGITLSGNTSTGSSASKTNLGLAGTSNAKTTGSNNPGSSVSLSTIADIVSSASSGAITPDQAATAIQSLTGSTANSGTATTSSTYLTGDSSRSNNSTGSQDDDAAAREAYNKQTLDGMQGNSGGTNTSSSVINGSGSGTGTSTSRGTGTSSSSSSGTSSSSSSSRGTSSSTGTSASSGTGTGTGTSTSTSTRTKTDADKDTKTNSVSSSDSTASDPTLTTLKTTATKAMSDYNSAILNSQQQNPDGSPNPNYDGAGWKQAASTAASTYIKAVQTWAQTADLGSFKQELTSYITAATKALTAFSAPNGETQGNALGQSLILLGKDTGQMSGVSLEKLGLDFTTAGVTAGGKRTYEVKAAVAENCLTVQDASGLAAGGTKPTAGDKIDLAVTDLKAQITKIYGTNVPTDVQAKFKTLSDVRDQWVGGNGALGNALSDASNKLAASIAQNRGGGSAAGWGDTGSSSKAATSTSSDGSTTTAEANKTSANNDWKAAGVSFSQSDINNAVAKTPPDLDALSGYLGAVGDSMDEKKQFEGKSSKARLGFVQDALSAKPYVKQNVANAIAQFSSTGIKASASPDLKKAYDAVVTGLLKATGLAGNTSVDKRGSDKVADDYVATL